MTRSQNKRQILPRVARLGSALVVVAAARVGLKLVTLPRLCGGLGIRLGTERGPASAVAAWTEVPAMTVQTLEAVDTVLRWWPGGSPCLTRALACGWLLRRTKPTLRIGALKLGQVGSWSAHAWLEVAEVPLPEPRHVPPVVSEMQRLGRL